MYELIIFLASAFVISFSGVMYPGAVTAATLALSTKNRNAGVWVAVGHGIIELPLIFLIMLGLDKIIQFHLTQILIAVIGGIILLLMGVQMLRHLSTADYNPGDSYKTGPILTGIIISALNPMFLIWWATIGLKLAIDAKSFGIIGFAMFAVVHWLCDLTWLGALGFAGNKGASLMSPKKQKAVLGICAIALIFFGIKFLISAAMK
jgi:threonine/homoserine/homoserine lactone efflux protein